MCTKMITFWRNKTFSVTVIYYLNTWTVRQLFVSSQNAAPLKAKKKKKKKKMLPFDSKHGWQQAKCSNNIVDNPTEVGPSLRQQSRQRVHMLPWKHPSKNCALHSQSISQCSACNHSPVWCHPHNGTGLTIQNQWLLY